MTSLPEKEEKLQAHLSRVLQELQEAQQGRLSRQDLIRRIEAHHKETPRRLLLYIANIDHPESGLHPNDVVPLCDALSQLGSVANLDVVLHTPGGYGETAEKFVEICRSHCQGEFRVVVPHMAKSAGTLIALGADKIVMGYCSELGPIDPQIPIVIGGNRQAVSAWTFVRTRDLLEKKVGEAIAEGKNPSAYLQQLAAIDPVFVTHCDQLLTFAKQLGRKWIAGRLTAQRKTPDEAGQLADEVIEYLSKVEEHITHGRLVRASDLIQNCGPTLDVAQLSENDALWQLLWELYVRCEVFLKSSPPKAKLVETADVSITLS